MIGKRIPTEDGKFKVEITTEDLKTLQPITTTDFFAEWMKQVIPEKVREPILEKVPLTIYEVDEDYIPVKVWETTVTSAAIKVYGVTYDIPLDMAISALQNIDVEISYTEGKKNE